MTRGKTNRRNMASASEYDAIETVPDEDVGDIEKFKKAMWRVTGFYSQFKQKLRSTKAATTALRITPSQFNIEYAKSKFHDCETQYNRLCNGLSVAEYIANEVADNTAKVETKQEVAKGEFENARDLFMNEIAKATTAPKLPPTQNTGTKPKIVKQFNDALKPFTLELENLPHEYRKWKKSMASYFRNNAIDDEDPVVQNEYVAACISADLDNFISADVEDAAPAYDSDVGIMTLIDKVYNMRHTMTSKRLALFSCKSKQGETPVAFIARLNMLYQEADLAAMTIDEMRTFFLISGITNATLRSKLIEMQNPTFEEACNKVNTWTATSSTSKAIEKSQGADGKAKAVKKDKGKRIDPPASIKVHPGSLAGKCFCCGSASHNKRDCERYDKSKCTECRQTGHYKNVCMQDYKTWRNKTFNVNTKDGKGKGGKAKKVEAEEDIKSAPPSEDEEESSNE